METFTHMHAVIYTKDSIDSGCMGEHNHHNHHVEGNCDPGEYFMYKESI